MCWVTVAKNYLPWGSPGKVGYHDTICVCALVDDKVVEDYLPGTPNVMCVSFFSNANVM